MPLKSIVISHANIDQPVLFINFSEINLKSFIIKALLNQMSARTSCTCYYSFISNDAFWSSLYGSTCHSFAYISANLMHANLLHANLMSVVSHANHSTVILSTI